MRPFISSPGRCRTADDGLGGLLAGDPLHRLGDDRAGPGVALGARSFSMVRDEHGGLAAGRRLDGGHQFGLGRLGGQPGRCARVRARNQRQRLLLSSSKVRPGIERFEVGGSSVGLGGGRARGHAREWSAEPSAVEFGVSSNFLLKDCGQPRLGLVVHRAMPRSEVGLGAAQFGGELVRSSRLGVGPAGFCAGSRPPRSELFAGSQSALVRYALQPRSSAARLVAGAAGAITCSAGAVTGLPLGQCRWPTWPRTDQRAYCANRGRCRRARTAGRARRAQRPPRTRPRPFPASCPCFDQTRGNVAGPAQPLDHVRLDRPRPRGAGRRRWGDPFWFAADMDGAGLDRRHRENWPSPGSGLSQDVLNRVTPGNY